MYTVTRASLALFLLTGVLGACGGGGGGSSSPAPSPPANTTPPSATIASIMPAQRVTDQAVTFSGAGTTPVANGVLSYSWNFGDGNTGAGASSTHAYATHGNYTVTLTVTDSGNLSTTATQDITVVAPPASPSLAIDSLSVTPNTAVNVTASGSDPQGSALTFTWDFGDGASANGNAASHAYSTAGTYVVRVTVTNEFGLSSTASTSPVNVAWLSLIPPSVILLNQEHLAGQTLFAQAAFVEPNGLPYTLDWTFGDGATIRTTDGQQKVAHEYALPGTYVVGVTATNSAGLTVSASRTASVQPLTSPPDAFDNVFLPYCAGSFCGAASPISYSGDGVGIWRYHNATAVDASIDIEIGGVIPQSAATLLFSNGKTTAAASVPGAGTGSPGSSKVGPAKNTGIRSVEQSHLRMLDANRHIALALPARSGANSVSTRPLKSTAARPRAATPIGTTRSWHEFFLSGETSTVVLRSSCEFSTGRNGLIWVDAEAFERGEIDPDRITQLAHTLCGPDGAYELLVALHGDVWGPAPAHLVQDGASLQDLHVVIPAVPQSSGFGGYFSAANLNTTDFDPGSNAAISVVLNGWTFANYPLDDASIRNTLIHELKHLINFYQRSIVRGATHAAWLEETSAMLAEDLVSPRASPWSRTEARIGGYVASGGGIGYLGWTHPEGNSYNLGGSFGSFLHRRYGASLDRELFSDCADDGTPESSYDCVHDYILRNGGLGFEDEFARMGASALGSMPTSGVPLGFGFPGLTVEGSALLPVGSSRVSGAHDDPPRDLGGNFGATMHTYSREFIAAGQSTYRRDDVIVPAGTTLLLVIAEPVN